MTTHLTGTELYDAHKEARREAFLAGKALSVDQRAIAAKCFDEMFDEVWDLLNAISVLAESIKKKDDIILNYEKMLEDLSPKNLKSEAIHGKN